MVCILEEILSRIQSQSGDTLQAFPQMPLYLWNSKRSNRPRLHEYQSKSVTAGGHQPSFDAIYLRNAPSCPNRGFSQTDS